MKDSIYRIYQLGHTDKPFRRLVARFAIHGGNVIHLEDHLHSLRDTLPEGVFSDDHKSQMLRMAHSPYYQIVNENNIEQGDHPDDVIEIDHGVNGPERTFEMTVPGAPKPFKLELTGRVVTVDGKRLSEQDAAGLLEQVKAGQISLKPLTAPAQ